MAQLLLRNNHRKMAHDKVGFDCIFKFVRTPNIWNAETESGLVNKPGMSVTGSA